MEKVRGEEQSSLAAPVKGRKKKGPFGRCTFRERGSRLQQRGRIRGQELVSREECGRWRHKVERGRLAQRRWVCKSTWKPRISEPDKNTS